MSDAAAVPGSIEALRKKALALAAQGRSDEAARAFEAILRDAGEDAEALNFLAIRAHARGSRQEALALLTRARAARPDDPTTAVNRGTLLREMGELEEACTELRAGLALAPDLFMARLQLGEALQALGRPAEALPAFFGAIVAAQQAGHWRTEAAIPPGLRPLVLRAMGIAGSGRTALFHGLLGPLRERHGAAALARVEKGLSMYLRDRPIEYADPRQRPRFFYMPDLPSTRVFERELFPWYEALEAETDAIREEMRAVYAERLGFEPFLGDGNVPHAPGSLLGGTSEEPVWDAFFFYRDGRRRDDNAARCPRSIAAFDAVPLCRIRDHSPEVCFSVLTPGSHILPHTGVTNTRLVTHLPLVVPDGDLAIDVSGITVRWQEGRCFSFDDTFTHEAWNRTDKTRVVVLMDVWNPHLTEVEREAITVLTEGIGDFNRAAGI